MPHWAKDLKFGARTINARAESLATTPAFRDAFAARRCLIPASGFYEWKKDGSTRTPYAIVPADEPLFAFAGLWENWRDRSGGKDAPWIRTCSIVTGEPNPVLAWPRWLGEEEASGEPLSALLTPFPPERMRLYPVSARVNSVKNDDAGLIEPLLATGGTTV